jgi:hypothetical protein
MARESRICEQLLYSLVVVRSTNITCALSLFAERTLRNIRGANNDYASQRRTGTLFALSVGNENAATTDRFSSPEPQPA